MHGRHGLQGRSFVDAQYWDSAWTDTLMYYANESDLQTATFQTIAPVDYYATRMTTQGDTLYTTWHSTHEVDKFSLPGGRR